MRQREPYSTEYVYLYDGVSGTRKSISQEDIDKARRKYNALHVVAIVFIVVGTVPGTAVITIACIFNFTPTFEPDDGSVSDSFEEDNDETSSDTFDIPTCDIVVEVSVDQDSEAVQSIST